MKIKLLKVKHIQGSALHHPQTYLRVSALPRPQTYLFIKLHQSASPHFDAMILSEMKFSIRFMKIMLNLSIV